ncbi:MAG: septum formation initiator family protein [Deltaproteobacteria bacterium]|nr:MAG: septum formation initiator family protein [Deltaproteobacteria bacterium]
MRKRTNNDSVTILIGFLFVGGMITYTIYGRHGLHEGMRLRQKHTELEEKIARLEAANQRLEAEIDALTHDADYIERYLRSTYGMVRETEVVYQVVE